MLLAASTGIVGATVITLGLLSLPAMLRRGYDSGLCLRNVAAAGTLGQIIPPSIVLIFLGDQLSIAYQSAQFAAGNRGAGQCVDQRLCSPVRCCRVCCWSGSISSIRSPMPMASGDRGSARRQHRGTAPGRRAELPDAVAPLVLIIAVLGSILSGIATAKRGGKRRRGRRDVAGGAPALPRRGRRCVAAACLLAGLVVLRRFRPAPATHRYRRWRLDRDRRRRCAVRGALRGGLVARLRASMPAVRGRRPVLQEILRTTLRITAMVFAIVIGASLFALVFRGFGGAGMIEAFLADLPGGPMTAMLVVIAVMFILGFFLDFLEIIYVVVPIVAPVLLQMEIAPGLLVNPVWLGVMMAIVLQTSFLTPPFGFALFYLRGVAPDEVATLQIYRGVAPFV